MGKQTWKHFVALWSRFGIKPEEATEILVKNWLDKNYTTLNGNLWKDKRNRVYFIKLVHYIYAYMKKKNIRWRAACLKLANNGDPGLADALTLMKVIPATETVSMSAVTCAKLLGQWRQEFFDNGWLNYDERPEIKIKRVEKSLRRAKLVKKKKK
jgi:hypothetical protein|tara:strand:+ start:2436 stop:2900 length:465 start_codon:yes stop_codon:yes gene_type:complete